MVLLGSQKLYYKNGVKMVSEQNEKAENVELSRLIKILGVLITFTRIHHMSGIRLVRNKDGVDLSAVAFWSWHFFSLKV